MSTAPSRAAQVREGGRIAGRVHRRPNGNVSWIELDLNDVRALALRVRDHVVIEHETGIAAGDVHATAEGVLYVAPFVNRGPGVDKAWLDARAVDIVHVRRRSGSVAPW